uniref:Uncharacterized protein n=1 Tax=Glyptapanteles indiensis TaxID=92994 RepID=A0JCV4_GLYIN|nr:hypothetical protein GIP_L1_00250 [Glyptapanteles indiensis]
MISMCKTLSALYLDQAFYGSPGHCAERRSTDKCQYTIQCIRTLDWLRVCSYKKLGGCRRITYALVYFTNFRIFKQLQIILLTTDMLI